MSHLRLGIIQQDPLVGDVAGNADQLRTAYTALLDADPDLVVTPELSLVGYPPRDLLHRPGVVDAQAAAVETLARETENGPPLVVGATVNSERATGPPLHNAAVLLRNGERERTYHKRLLPTYDVFDEHRYFEPGTGTAVVSVDGVDVGLTVCEDAWHDAAVTGQRRHGSNPLGETAADGADLLVTISASPFSLDKPAARERRFRDHAEATGCPVAFANQVGGNDELIFDGHSFVASGDGTVARLDGFEEATAVVDVPVGDDETEAVGEYDRPRHAQARAALRLGLRDYFAKTGFEEAVVGLSGGIDSSVAVTLAADALGAENVYGVSLPSRITSQQSIDDARAVAENLGIEFDVVPVGPAVETLQEQLADHAQPLTGLAAENIQARVRGAVLMGIANERDALVLTPDNKSEAAVGYCTLYGDTVGALAPLGDCYKSLVYDLAAGFNESPPGSASSVIPDAVIEKAPSAELREDQTDADDLPPYEELDPILAEYVEGTRGGSELRERHDDDAVDDVLARVTRAEFKRRQTPPPLRVTGKSFGRGWNYPIAASYEHVTERDG